MDAARQSSGGRGVLWQSVQPVQQARRARKVEQHADRAIGAEAEHRRNEEDFEVRAHRPHGGDQARFDDFSSFMISSGSGSLRTASYIVFRRPSNHGSNSGSLSSGRAACSAGLRLGTLDRSVTPASAHVPELPRPVATLRTTEPLVP